MIEMAAPPSTAAQAMMIHTLEPMDPVATGGNRGVGGEAVFLGHAAIVG